VRDESNRSTRAEEPPAPAATWEALYDEITTAQRRALAFRDLGCVARSGQSPERLEEVENVWDRAVKEGRDVAVDIRPVYAGDGARPTRFIVEYTVDGVSSPRRFPNAPGGARP
jgi:hypothetical protein